MQRNQASFRDPAGYVFEQEGEVYRAIDASYFSVFDHLHKCGLYDKLVQEKLLIPHTLVSKNEQQIVIKHSVFLLSVTRRSGRLACLKKQHCCI